ncbi:Stabilin-2 [Chytridiales sp. JEL 0842]|nr:Stabilin-2 [Chytridiales sp. JEL 0842]
MSLTTSNRASTLLSLVSAQPAILDTLSKTQGPITLFAPTDDAFRNTLPPGFNASDSAAVASVLTYHVVGDTTFLPGASTPARSFVKTLRKNPLNFDEPTSLRVDFDANANTVKLAFGLPTANVVSSTPILNGNGVIHYVDSVLLPPPDLATTAAAVPDLKTLLDTIVATELAGPLNSLKGITVLAPTNAAFAAIADTVKTLTKEQIQSILALHVLPGVIASTDLPATLDGVQTYLPDQTLSAKKDGQGVSFAGKGNTTPAKVAIADVLVGNGIVHVIDTVLLPDLANLKPVGSIAQIAPKSGASGTAGSPAKPTGIVQNSAPKNASTTIPMKAKTTDDEVRKRLQSIEQKLHRPLESLPMPDRMKSLIMGDFLIHQYPASKITLIIQDLDAILLISTVMPRLWEACVTSFEKTGNYPQSLLCAKRFITSQLSATQRREVRQVSAGAKDFRDTSIKRALALYFQQYIRYCDTVKFTVKNAWRDILESVRFTSNAATFRSAFPSLIPAKELQRWTSPQRNEVELAHCIEIQPKFADLVAVNPSVDADDLVRFYKETINRINKYPEHPLHRSTEAIAQFIISKELRRLTQTPQDREQELKSLLSLNGLAFRSDSRLSALYIKGEISKDIEHVVSILKITHELFNFGHVVWSNLNLTYESLLEERASKGEYDADGKPKWIETAVAITSSDVFKERCRSVQRTALARQLPTETRRNLIRRRVLHEFRTSQHLQPSNRSSTSSTDPPPEDPVDFQFQYAYTQLENLEIQVSHLQQLSKQSGLIVPVDIHVKGKEGDVERLKKGRGFDVRGWSRVRRTGKGEEKDGKGGR